MLIFRGYKGLPETARGAVVAIGNFDGVHHGHQVVIGAAGSRARELGRAHAVLTFEPHPRSFFRPDDPPFRLTPFRVKSELLDAFGVDLLFTLHFDAALAAMSAEAFIGEVLVERLAIRHAVVGYDFVFGNRRRGTAAMLGEAGKAADFGVTIVEPVRHGEAVYSSTRIRELLAAGRPREAAGLLGRAWEIDGRVEAGDRRGRTIGFPTANLSLDAYLRPAAGVYAVRAGIGHEARFHDAVANFGRRPTVGGSDLRLEVHLFDFAGDLYGQHLRVQLLDYLRPERKFASLDSLKAQIAEDSRAARAALDRAGVRC